MAGANVNLGVSGLAAFKRNIDDAKATVKAFDEALKLNEKQADTSSLYVQNKITIMKDQIEAQTEVVRNTQAQLEAMVKEGKSTSSAAYQKVLGQQYSETSKLQDMKKALQDLETESTGAAEGIGSVEESVKNIDKNVSWKNVAEGIGKVADTLERGARSAFNFGKKIISSLKGSSGWADDLQTMSDAFDVPMDKLQRMEKVSYRIETDTETILRAQQKMSRAAAGDGAETIMDLFGINVAGQDPDELFWQLGDAILHMGDAFEQEDAAQKVFGRSWRELVPLFKLGRDEYDKLLDKQKVLTDDQIKNLTEADDTIAQMELEIQSLKNQFWSENATKITDLMQWLIDNKDGVVTALALIAGGIEALKLAEAATNVMSIVEGFKSLGLIKGGAAAASAAASAAPAGTSAAAAAGGGLGISGWAGLGGAFAIAAGTMWAANQRLNHRDKVRGTDEYLAAQSAGAEQLLAEWIQANQAMSALETKWDATIEEVDAVQARIDAAKAALDEAEGGADALKAYSDWRQERSLGNMDWEMPENIDKMTRTVQESFSGQAQSNSEMTAAANDLKGLPAAVATAVENGMSRVTIVIDDRAVSAIGRKVGRNIGSNVQALIN